jgi:Arc/MetJ family transcription regulator
MRTTIDIDDRLLRRAMRLSGNRTKKATIEAGLLVQIHAQTGIRQLKGEVRWDGKLEESRRGRTDAPPYSPPA